MAARVRHSLCTDVTGSPVIPGLAGLAALSEGGGRSSLRHRLSLSKGCPVPRPDPDQPTLWQCDRSVSTASASGCGRSRTGSKSSEVVPEESPEQTTLRKLMVANDLKNCCLKVWFRHFDKNLNGRIDFQEFSEGMAALNFKGNILELWNEMDDDKSGEITFEEIDKEEAQLWNTFRRWCGKSFQGPRDMLAQVKAAHFKRFGVSHYSQEVISFQEFEEGLKLLGWDKGFENLLFHALDQDGEGFLKASFLKWVELEVRVHQQKENAKKRAVRSAAVKVRNQKVSQANLQDFKQFLKKQFGPLYRGWRQALDHNGSMTIQKAELFKVCRAMNYHGDVRLLWKALDNDASGITTFQELDPHGAQLLAQFKEWATTTWGSKKPVAAMFQDLDCNRRRKISYAQFQAECEARGFNRRAKTLAYWLDWQDKKCLSQEDFAFFDSWKTPAWLTAVPNPASADEFRRKLKEKYRHFLKAWRVAMDKDGSNCCSWHEFQEACNLVKHTNDVAGAWLALDEDVSGYISLREIDPPAHDILVTFKLWADEEFGGVRSAFRVLDRDGSGELTFKEFRGACRNYGFTGDVKALFVSLDIAGEGFLRIKDVSFLDEWEMCPEERRGSILEDAELPEDLIAAQRHEEAPSHEMLEYQTPVPGPGAYNIPSAFAPGDKAPFGRHGGAFSFTNRRPYQRQEKTVGPAKYDPCLKPMTSRKPAWSFGGSAPRCMGAGDGAAPLSAREARSPGRPRTATPSRGGGRNLDLMRTGAVSPGPGAYDVRPSSKGPMFSMRPRRGIVLHPSTRTAGLSDRPLARPLSGGAAAQLVPRSATPA